MGSREIREMDTGVCGGDKENVVCSAHQRVTVAPVLELVVTWLTEKKELQWHIRE